MKINNKGFSLLEVLIYITVIAMVTTIVGGIFLSIAGGQARVDAATELNSSLRFVADKIDQDIMSASAITQPPIAGQTTNTLTMTIGGSTIGYCAVNNRLYRSGSGACDSGDEPLTGQNIKVSNLSFARLENTNSVLAKSIVTIQTSLTFIYNGANQISATKQITSSLP